MNTCLIPRCGRPAIDGHLLSHAWLRLISNIQHEVVTFSPNYLRLSQLASKPIYEPSDFPDVPRLAPISSATWPMFCQDHEHKFSPIDSTDSAVDWADDDIWPLAVIRAAAGMLARYTYLADANNSYREFPNNYRQLQHARFLWSRLCSPEVRIKTSSESMVSCTREKPVAAGAVFSGWYSPPPEEDLIGWYCITVAPYPGGHRILLAYGSLLSPSLTKGHLNFMGRRLGTRFVTQEPGTPGFRQTLTRELLAAGEDVCVAPTHWERFTQMRKQATLEWFFETFDTAMFLSDEWEAIPMGAEHLVDLFSESVTPGQPPQGLWVPHPRYPPTAA